MNWRPDVVVNRIKVSEQIAKLAVVALERMLANVPATPVAIK